MAYTFFNFDRMVVYEVSITDGTRQTTTMSPECIDYVRSPLGLSCPSHDVHQTLSFSFVWDAIYPANTFRFINQLATLADLINEWNFQAIKLGQHNLAMYIDYSDPDAQHVYVMNTSEFAVHLWAVGGVQRYFGTWAPYDIRHFNIADFLSAYPLGQSFDAIPPARAPTSPFVVGQSISVFEATAYLYRRGHTGGFYTKSELLTIPAGFYRDLQSFVAAVNASITMRGERNGFIYHFIVDSSLARIGIEATHRQPEPSVLVLTPLSGSGTDSLPQTMAVALGLGNSLVPITLPLRTARKVYFPEDMAYVI